MSILWMWVIVIGVVIFVLAAVRNEDKRKQKQRLMENTLLNQAREIEMLNLKLLDKDGLDALKKKREDDQGKILRGGWTALDPSWRKEK